MRISCFLSVILNDCACALHFWDLQSISYARAVLHKIPERSSNVKRGNEVRYGIGLGSCPCFFEPYLALSTAMPKKNPHAVALGRLGGLKGGKARTAKLTPEERRALARKAALARWAKARMAAQREKA